jgi:hypothetical protein
VYYVNFYLLLEYASSLTTLAVNLEETWGVKPRTARGYATIIICAKVQ